MCRANAEAGGAVPALSAPREGRDRNRNGRASALYLLQSSSTVPAASVVTRAAVASVVCETADQIDPNQTAHPGCRVEIAHKQPAPRAAAMASLDVAYPRLNAAEKEKFAGARVSLSRERQGFRASRLQGFKAPRHGR
jgi:hypothetical protein